MLTTVLQPFEPDWSCVLTSSAQCKVHSSQNRATFAICTASLLSHEARTLYDAKAIHSVVQIFTPINVA